MISPFCSVPIVGVLSIENFILGIILPLFFLGISPTCSFPDWVVCFGKRQEVK